MSLTMKIRPTDTDDFNDGKRRKGALNAYLLGFGGLKYLPWTMVIHFPKMKEKQ